MTDLKKKCSLANTCFEACALGAALGFIGGGALGISGLGNVFILALTGGIFVGIGSVVLMPLKRACKFLTNKKLEDDSNKDYNPMVMDYKVDTVTDTVKLCFKAGVIGSISGVIGGTIIGYAGGVTIGVISGFIPSASYGIVILSIFGGLSGSIGNITVILSREVYKFLRQEFKRS